jgi:hypothetical protein
MEATDTSEVYCVFPWKFCNSSARHAKSRGRYQTATNWNELQDKHRKLGAIISIFTIHETLLISQTVKLIKASTARSRFRSSRDRGRLETDAASAFFICMQILHIGTYLFTAENTSVVAESSTSSKLVKSARVN